MKTLKSVQDVSGAKRPSSVTTAQSLQYYAFSDKLIHDKQLKSIIDKGYRYGAHTVVKSPTLYCLVIYHRI